MDPSALKFHEVGAEYLKMVPFYTSGKPAWRVYPNGVARYIKKRFTSSGKCQKLKPFCHSEITLSIARKPVYYCDDLATVGRDTINKLNCSTTLYIN